MPLQGQPIDDKDMNTERGELAINIRMHITEVAVGTVSSAHHGLKDTDYGDASGIRTGPRTGLLTAAVWNKIIWIT